jgi:hypothetical protein
VLTGSINLSEAQKKERTCILELCRKNDEHPNAK